jgi:hypothetical protein
MPVTDTTAGFRFMGRMSKGSTTIIRLKFKDTETLTKGDMLNVESGEIDLGATGDTALIGIALKTIAGVDSTTEIEVIADDDAIYAVYDPNARVVGAFLDLTGATGAQSVGSATNNEFIVIAPSAADELTLVRINPVKHARA